MPCEWNIKRQELNKYIQQRIFSEKKSNNRKQVHRKYIIIWTCVLLGSIISKQANVAKLTLNPHTAAKILLVEENV